MLIAGRLTVKINVDAKKNIAIFENFTIVYCVRITENVSYSKAFPKKHNAQITLHLA